LKRKLLLITAFVFAILLVRAQDYIRPGSATHDYYTGPDAGAPKTSSKKFSLGVSFGVAIPLQDFASTNVQNSFWDFHSPDSVRLQGFAKTGFHFNLTASYLITDNIGVMLSIGGSSNPFDVNAFSTTMGYPSYTSTESYYTSEYLIGPYFFLQLSSKFRLKLSAMIGLAANSYPTMDLAINDTTTYERDINGGSGLAFCFGAGVEYQINDNLSLLLNVAYTETKISYSGWIESSSNGYYIQTWNHSTDVETMSTGLLKPTLGIDYKF
jgi:outer membrane protein W